MRLRYKILCASLGVVGVAGVIAAISIDYKQIPIVYANGSSSVLPLIQALSEKHHKQDIISNAGGSSLGIIEAVEQRTNIGVSSRSPNIDFEQQSVEKSHVVYDKWKQNQLKTYTIAWDGIGIIYKLNKTNHELVLTKDNIIKLFKAFTGNEQVSYYDLDPQLPKTPILAYSRTGGANASGTAEAFLTSNPLISKKEFKKKYHDIYKVIEAGTYGKLIRSTEESNTQAWTNISKDNVDGSITYLSTGFILKNYDQIIAKGYKIAYLQNKDLKNYLPFEINENKQEIVNVAKTYGWYRPFNLVFSLNMQGIKNTKEFVWWLLTNKKVEKIIQESGFIPLTFEQKNSMFLKPYKDEQSFQEAINNQSAKNNFFVGDFELIESNRINILGAKSA
ncbi:PstS family phosphate ABC transporter substrate-binding protein [Ureaplasma urealyticum]|uniref:PstS family phosphate ABC transporter substrate-binding protein n=1 Tax=Ureaplasma urealyticum TaxID=2130 RepID=UPI001F60A032|nr:PstS family phosphate ABC transporter substrate-binding protein [Ureaplasma urealyticum]UNT66393.1 PstS family phosphate ABC transporter substrate-binding protein [Ureaplasma urealyticum]